jgi:hypothetical protein
MLPLAQSTPIRLVIPEPPPAAPAPGMSIDPLWVLLALITGAMLVAGMLIARSVWADMLTRRPADAALWLLLVRRGMGVRSARVLRRLAGVLGPGVHPVALICSPPARARALEAFARSTPTPAHLARARRVVARLG